MSTHSDITENVPKSKLEGVLNSFKVDMKTKQLSRPKTASRLHKPSLTSHTKLPNKNASTNAIEVIQMTGWEEEPDRFDRDIFFSWFYLIILCIICINIICRRRKALIRTIGKNCSPSYSITKTIPKLYSRRWLSPCSRGLVWRYLMRSCTVRSMSLTPIISSRK